MPPLLIILLFLGVSHIDCQFIYPGYQHSLAISRAAGLPQSQPSVQWKWPGQNLAINSFERLADPAISAPSPTRITEIKPPAPAPIEIETIVHQSTEEVTKEEAARDIKEAQEVLKDLFPGSNDAVHFNMPAPPVAETGATLDEGIPIDFPSEETMAMEEESESQQEVDVSESIIELGEVPPSFSGNQHFMFNQQNDNGLIPAIPIPLLIRAPPRMQETTDCIMNPWTPWSACTVSCNTGEQARSRSVKVLSKRGGLPCPESYQERQCNTFSCPLPDDCKLANWTPWTACSRQCGGGIQARSRAVITQAQIGGRPCEPTYQEQACHVHDCPKKRSCVLDPWSPWSSCSRMCGGGQQARSRTILTSPDEGAPPCGKTHETRNCNDSECPENCVLSLWEAWSPCTRSCGGGEKARRRIVLRQATEGGRSCPNGLDEITQCNLHQCPADCELGEWEAWNRCSHTCGGGLRMRSRRILRESVAGGRPCPFRDSLKHTQACNSKQCPVDCDLSNWSPWTDCSAECGGGQKFRERTILQNSQYGGKNCPAESMLKQNIQCNPHPCPLDCRLNDWEPWSQCSRTCGGGERYRRRLVLQPPYAGGKECPPASQLRESELCSTNMCPVDCMVGEWGHWSQCSNCGGGVKSRWRPIIRENAAGGSDCPVPSELQKVEECFEECPEPEVVVVRQPIVVRQKETQLVKQPVIVRQPVVKVTQRQPIIGSAQNRRQDQEAVANSEASLEDESNGEDRERSSRRNAASRPNAQIAREGLNNLRSAAQNRFNSIQRARASRRRTNRVTVGRQQRQSKRN